MTRRQKIIKTIYPLIMGMSKVFKKREKVKINPADLPPPISFYSLKAAGIDGQEIPFDHFKGKKVLLVNTASDCGFTPQYEDLQRLHEKYRDQLIIIGFPANDFQDQEKGADAEIASFCRINYQISFPLAKKSTVIKGAGQNKVFEWLSDKQENGWNEQPPVWNFSKYLVNEKGVLTHYFDPSISPLSNEMISAVEK